MQSKKTKILKLLLSFLLILLLFLSSFFYVLTEKKESANQNASVISATLLQNETI